MVDPKLAAEDFLNEFKKFSDKELKNEIDVFNLIEAIFKKDQYQLLEDIAFTSKYCTGLYKILEQNSQDLTEEYKKEITKSFTETVEKVREILITIITEFTEFNREAFKVRYIQLNQASLNNLLSLINDFSKIKLFLNSRKRQAF